MLLGILGAILAALAYGSATILQALGVKSMKQTPKDAPFGVRIRSAWQYAAGLALDGVGFLASTGALRTLPLFLVQSVIASSVGVTAVLAVIVLKSKISKREVAALVVVALGLIALSLTAKDGPPHGVPHHMAMMTCLAALGVTALAGLGYAIKNSSLLALAAGLGFSGVGIAARILPWHGSVIALVATWALWALIAHGIVSNVAYGFALEQGQATSVAAITFAVETVVPAAIGMLFLGDAVRPHTGILAAIGFILTLGGCVALAGHSEQEA